MEEEKHINTSAINPQRATIRNINTFSNLSFIISMCSIFPGVVHFPVDSPFSNDFVGFNVKVHFHFLNLGLILKMNLSNHTIYYLTKGKATSSSAVMLLTSSFGIRKAGGKK